MAEIESGMTLYDINKSAYNNLDKMNEIKLSARIKKMKSFFTSGERYFMLLCREKNDYTVFKFENKNEKSVDIILKEFEECIRNRGSILDIEKTEDNYAYEIWIKDIMAQESFCYLLFPYTSAVIEVE